MKSHTLSALRENQRYKLPYIMDDEDELFDTDGILHSEKCKIFPVEKYHYNERWYHFKYSVDNPEEIFGILKVENIPYRSFYDKQEKLSFIASMERMVTQNHIVPFMLFIDNKFVNWNDIDVVFDCGETYLLLHGDKYNWYNLKAAGKFNIVTLPFKVEYIGSQTDDAFNLNLSALTEFLQSSMDKVNGKIVVSVPTMDSDFTYNDDTYNIGAWLYRQIKLNYLGLLAKDKVDQLKKISLVRYVEDDNGDRIDTYTTRFNALDKDVYDQELYDSLCYMDLNQYESHKLFSFNDDGYLDKDGCNIFYILTDNMYYDHYTASTSVIYNDHMNINNILQRENYLVFKNGELDVDCEIYTGLNNLMRIINRDENTYDVFTFYPMDAEQVYQIPTFNLSQDYLNAKAKEYFELSKKAQTGVKAILMNEDGSDSDRIIDRLDVAFVDRFYTDYYQGIIYINEEYKLLALLMGDDGNLTGEKITGLDFGPRYEGESITVDDTLGSSLVAKVINNESDLGDLSIKSSFIMIDPKTNNKIELITASNDKLYAIVLENEVKDTSFKYIDPYNTQIAYLDENTMTLVFDPKDKNLDGKYVYLENADNELHPLVLINGGMYAEIFDRGDQSKDEKFDGEFLLIDTSVDYGIIFIDRKVFAMSMDEDGTFNGNNIENIIFENIGDSNIMNLEGSVLLDYRDAEIIDYITLAMQCLDFMLSDKLPYLDNMNNAIQAIVDYNVSMFNQLNHTNIESTVLSGEEVNRNLDIPLGAENRRGIKIPRQKFYNHETFCMIFLNGELIEQYSKMIAYHDFFFIPIEDDYEFEDADEIEIMYFLNCDNNEINFKLTEYVMATKLGEARLEGITALLPNDLNEMMNGSMQSNINSLDDAKLKYRYITTDGVYMQDKDPNEVYANVLKADIFSKFIRPEDLKIFEKYPENILLYPELIDRDNDIAFNVSFSEDGETYLYPEVMDNTNDIFTAVSKRKFIYQRLYVDQKAYRIKLAKRFRFCDNQKQYVLFINGRRIYEESFFVTTPKYSRPFWGIYLYLTKFVTPEDRVEIFYVPEEMQNTNVGNTIELKEDGYIETDKTSLDVPFDTRLYLFFINGKKINPDNMTVMSSNMLRMSKDTRTLMPLVINKVYTDTMPEVVEYMHDPDRLCKYDDFIEQIKNASYLGKDELDRIFGIYVHMSDYEENMLKQNVGRIAVINEIVRDFWVTSGYPYHTKPFIYDYDLDEIIYQDDNGNYIMPALDANYELNIRKNDTHLLYFTADPAVNFCEKGSVLDYINFIWDYSLSLYNDSLNLNIVKQTINDHSIDTSARSYEWTDPITEDTDFLFTGNTGSKLLQDHYQVKFVNPIYYGLINEDAFKHYRRNAIISLEDLIALVPKNGILPSEEEMLRHMEIPYIIEELRKDYYIFRNLMLVNEKYLTSNYVLIDDLIAIIPEDWKELMDGTMDIIAEDGLEAVKERYKWMSFDNLLLVDPNEEPIEFLKWIKAIIPADEKDVMGYPDRLTSKNGVILMDDHIDTVFAITLGTDGRYNGKKIYNLDLIYDNTPWSFFEFLDDGVYAIKMDEDGVLTNDIIDGDITFLNTDKDVIKGFHYIIDPDQEWSTIQFIDDLMVITGETSAATVSDNESKLTFVNTDMSKIGDLDYIKELVPEGINLIDELVGFLLDANGNETEETISGFTYREVDDFTSSDTDDTVVREYFDGALDGIPSDVDADTMLEDTIYASIIDEDGNDSGIILNIEPKFTKTSAVGDLPMVDFSEVIALTMNDKGEFLKDLIEPPEDKETFFYLGDDNDETMLAIADPENYDRSAKTDNTEYMDDGFNAYAMVMDDNGEYTGKIINNVFGVDGTEDNENAQFLDGTIYANVLDSDGNESGKVINFLDYVGAKHSVSKTDKVDRIVDLYDCMLLEEDTTSNTVFLSSLTAVMATDDTIMSGLMEAKSDAETMDDLIAKYNCVSSDFLLMNNNEEPIHLVDGRLMAIIPANEADVMGYPDRLTASEGVILMDDNIDSIFAIPLDGSSRRFTKVEVYDESPWDLFEVLNNGVYAIKMDDEGLLTNDMVDDLTFLNTDKSVIYNVSEYVLDNDQEWDNLQFVDTLLTMPVDSSSYDSDGTLTFVNTDISVIENLDYAKELLPEGVTLVDELIGFLLDSDGNETDSTINGLSYDEEGTSVYSDNSDVEVETDAGEKYQLNGIPSDVDTDDIADDIVYASIIDDDGNETGVIFNAYTGIKLSSTGSIVLDGEDLNGLVALTMNDNGELLKDLISPESEQESIIYLNDDSEIMAIADTDAYEASISTDNTVEDSAEESNDENLQFLSDSIYANILDSEGNETDKVIDLINYVGGNYQYLDAADKSDRIIYFDDYILANTDITDAVFTKYLIAILADAETTSSGIIERQYDSKTLDEVTKAFKSLYGDFLMVDLDQIPLEYLSWLSAISPTDYDELMSSDEDPEETAKHLKGLSLSDGMVYNPSTDSIDSYSGFMAIVLNEDGTVSDKVIHDIGIASNEPTTKQIFPIGDVVDIDDLDLFALLENGERIYSKFNVLDVNGNSMIMSDRELNNVIAHIDKYLQDTPDVDIKYPMGNHNYFIYAIPKYYAYTDSAHKNISFELQDLKDKDFLQHTLNQSTPIYTSGDVDSNNNLETLNIMNMTCLGETEFTSEYGITEKYVVWMTNGYFTRIQEDYGIKFKAQSVA
jgi:hypothetical protein